MSVLEDTLTAEQELEKVRKALAAANKEAKQYREQAEALQAKVAELEEKPKALQSQLVAAEAKTRLLAAGVKDADRFIKYLDTSKVGEDFAGLDDAINTMKTDFPEVFEPKRRVAGQADAATQGDTPKMTGTQAQVARLLGRR